MKNSRKKFWSKKPMGHAAIRLPESERDLWRAAALKAGISLNDLCRAAIREKSSAILASDQNTAA